MPFSDDDEVLYHEYGEEYGRRYNNDVIKNNINLARPFAVASFVGSIFIIYDILLKDRLLRSIQRRETRGTIPKMKMADQIMLGLSFCDCITSLMWFLGSWPAPKGQAYGAYGTRGTCTLQGLLVWYLTPTARLYNATLAICYVLMVRYAWSEHKLLRFRYAFLLCPHIMGLLVAVPLLIDDGFNWNGESMCGPSTYPTWCDRSYTDDTEDDDEVDCTRGGKNLSVAGTKVGSLGTKIMAPMDMCLAGFIILVSMFILFWSVRSRERRNQRYDFRRSVHHRNSSSTDQRRWSSSQQQRHPGSASNETLNSDTSRSQSQSSLRQIRQPRLSQQVAIQGFLYCLCYWTTVLPFLSVMAIFWLGEAQWSWRDWITPMVLVTLPIQGFFNAFVYIRPRMVTWYRERNQQQQQGCCKRLQGQQGQDGEQQPQPPEANPASQSSQSQTNRNNIGSSSTGALQPLDEKDEKEESEGEGISAFLKMPINTNGGGGNTSRKDKNKDEGRPTEISIVEPLEGLNADSEEIVEA